jgi:hypothetical protein
MGGGKFISQPQGLVADSKQNQNGGRLQRLADRKVWPGARTGAKGPRPTHGRVGAGLASPAGIGAGAGVIISQRDFINQPGVDAERLRRVVIAN